MIREKKFLIMLHVKSIGDLHKILIVHYSVPFHRSTICPTAFIGSFYHLAGEECIILLYFCLLFNQQLECVLNKKDLGQVAAQFSFKQGLHE